MKKRLQNTLMSVESTRVATAIRSGLTMLIPVLLIGSLMLVLRNLPISFYQSFVKSFADGFILTVCDFIYNATFNMLSVFVTIFISYRYYQSGEERSASPFGAMITSLVVFFILVGVLAADTDWQSAIGVKGMFTAIVSGTVAPYLYSKLSRVVELKTPPYSDGADSEFIRSVGVFFPSLIIIFAFAILNSLVARLFDVSTLHALFIEFVTSIFSHMGRGLLSGLLMVLLSSLMWFFGIHGSDVLESVMDSLFTPARQININLVAFGQEPTEILTKEFFDVFVLIGGCGTALCLLLAMLLFSRKTNHRRLGSMAALPILFNINEILIFGYPVIYNPILLLPFILTPVVSFLISYGAMASGLVPLVTASVNWTTPVLLGGYQATGSLMGSLLQLVNVAVGVAIYRPFILASDRNQERLAKQHLEELADIVRQDENSLTETSLTGLASVHGEVARALSADLEHAMVTDALTLYYQPQYNNRGELIGAEALLRWFHPLYGSIYPPLIIALAREAGILPRLEQRIFARAARDAIAIREITARNIEMSVNVSADTLRDSEYLALLRRTSDEGSLDKGSICIEITEQMALLSGEEVYAIFGTMRKAGYKFAIDDFSMGHTSMAYLQEHRFDLVKLDGSIVLGIRDNPRCRDIIASIIHLSKSLGFEVLAEFVETEEIRAALEEIGCNLYQGYLYSPALPRDELIKRLNASKSAEVK